MGEDYPVEVAASSSCDWPLLGLMTARLRMRPGQLLVDVGCGTGGIGLWLARALALRLEGFDLSPVAAAQATDRCSRFGLSADEAAFHAAELEDTGPARLQRPRHRVCGRPRPRRRPGRGAVGPEPCPRDHGWPARRRHHLLPDEDAARRFQQACHTPYFRPYTSTDVTGCELGGG